MHLLTFLIFMRHFLNCINLFYLGIFQSSILFTLYVHICKCKSNFFCQKLDKITIDYCER